MAHAPQGPTPKTPPPRRRAALLGAIPLALGLLAGASTAAAQTDEPICPYPVDALYSVARADAAWLGEVVGIRTTGSSGGPFVVTTKGTYRVRTTSVLKGSAPKTARNDWSITLSDDGEVFGGSPGKGDRYFVTKVNGELDFTRELCVVRLTALKPRPLPEPTGAALIAAGKAERLNGDLQRARGMTTRGWEQIYQKIMAYEKGPRRATPEMSWDFLLATLEMGQIRMAIGDQQACSNLLLADLSVKTAASQGFDTTAVRAELNDPAIKSFCPGTSWSATTAPEQPRPPEAAASRVRPGS